MVFESVNIEPAAHVVHTPPLGLYSPIPHTLGVQVVNVVPVIVGVYVAWHVHVVLILFTAAFATDHALHACRPGLALNKLVPAHAWQVVPTRVRPAAHVHVVVDPLVSVTNPVLQLQGSDDTDVVL